MFEKIKEDMNCILEKDPAAKSRWEVLTCYPGLHAVIMYRWANACWRRGFRWLGRFISHIARWLTGIEIHPGATIGRRVFIDHGMGVVIGETAEVGDDCTIYQGVTLGGTSLYQGKRHPTLGKGVIVGANAMILGGFTVGDGAKIGSAAVVVKEVPAGATAVGNPARVLGAEVEKAPEAMMTEAQDDTAKTKAPQQAGQEDGEPFFAYAVSNGDDPAVQTMRVMLEGTKNHEEQIMLLWGVIEQLVNDREITLPEGVQKESLCKERLEQLEEKFRE